MCKWLLFNAKCKSAISWREQVIFWWYDDNFRFVLYQYAYLDLHSANSQLTQQSAGRHVAPLGYIILIPSKLVYSYPVMLRALIRNNKYQLHKCLVWPDRVSNPRSTALEQANHHTTVAVQIKRKTVVV
jgi:hypothetical protein